MPGDALDHQIVYIEKAGSGLVVRIVKNADGLWKVIAINTDSRHGRARRIVKGNNYFGQIGDDLRLNPVLRFQLESGADRHLAAFKGNCTACSGELHALGNLQRRRYDVSIRCVQARSTVPHSAAAAVKAFWIALLSSATPSPFG